MTTGVDQPALGYLVPQFPAQTHAFYWREIRALERAGQRIALLSTRPAPPGIVAHAWSGEAAARTTYLASRSPRDALRALPALPPGALLSREPGLARDILLALPAAARLTSVARQQDIGHVHVHSCGRAALIAALARRLGGPTYSLTLHNPLHVYGPGQRLKWQGAAFATVVNRALLAEVTATLGDVAPPRVVVQPTGVDTGSFRRPGPYNPPRPGAPVRLMATGRLNPVKGHVDLLDAVGRLVGQGHDVRLDIAGQDEEGGHGYRLVLEQEIARRGLGDRVTLLGAIDEMRVRDALGRAHLFTLASHDEGVPVAVMEAMACGTPVVVTDVGGTSELVRSGENGLLVPPRDPGRMAAAIAGLIADPDRAARLAAEGRRTVESRFSSDRGADTLLAELAQVHSPAR